MKFPQPRLHRPSGLLRCRCKGREIYLGKPGTAEADRAYKSLLATLVEHDGELPAGWKPRREDSPSTLQRSERQPFQRVTVGDILADAMLEASHGKTQAELRLDSLWWRLRTAAAFLEPYASWAAEDFGPRALLDIASRLSVEPIPRTNKPRTVTRQQEIIKVIKRVWRDAVAREQVAPDRLVALESLRRLPKGKLRPPVRREPVEDTSLEALGGVLEPRYLDVLWFLRWTALRPGEALRASHGDVDKSGHPWWLRLSSHKTLRVVGARRVPLGPRAIATICEGKSGPLFPAAGGGFMKAAALNKAVHRACARAGVAEFCPYQLRHTALTALREQAGLDAAQAIAGHTSAAMTENYARASVARMLDAVRDFG